MSNPIEEAANKLRPPTEDTGLPKGTAERQLEEQIGKLENKRIALSIAGELCADPRWAKLMEWAEDARNRQMEALVWHARRGDTAIAASCAGQIEILDLIRARESDLQKEDQKLARQIKDLQMRRAEAQYMDAFGA